MPSEDLERVLKKVVEDSLNEIKSLLDAGEAEALSIVEASKLEASKEAMSIIESARKQADAEKQRLLSMAELEVRKESLSIIEEYVNSIMQKALEKLRSSYLMDGYRDAMKGLLEEAILAIGGDVIAQTNEGSIAILSDVAKELSERLNVRINIDKPIDCIAGVKVMSIDGKKIFDNTVEGRLQRMRAMLRKEIAKILLK